MSYLWDGHAWLLDIRKSDMNLSESFSVAVTSLLANRVRLILTMLGIIIGVSAVITMISLGEGAKRAVEQQIQQLGTNILTVRPGSMDRAFRRASGATVRFTLDEVEAVRENATMVDAVIPEYDSYTQMKYANNVTYARVIGTTPEYEWVRNAPVARGEYFSNTDNARRERVAVIGEKVRQSLFGDNPYVVGEEFRVKNINFTIVGVLEEKGEGWGDPDNVIIVPIETAQRRLFGTDRIDEIIVSVTSVDMMDAAMIEIEQILRKYLRLQPDEDNTFSVRSQLDFLSTFGEASKTLTTLLASIAAVSLLVGGIGIMNIMLVSVTERTREIGVRMAIGARKKDIRFQFLIEAVVIAMIGGIIGILLGVGGAFALSEFAQWNTTIAPNSIALAFLFAFIVGVIFGLFPAYKASNLDPIDSLRYE